MPAGSRRYGYFRDRDAKRAYCCLSAVFIRGAADERAFQKTVPQGHRTLCVLRVCEDLRSGRLPQLTSVILLSMIVGIVEEVVMIEKLTTLDLRQRLGDLLNRVALRHDEFIIERK